MGKALLPCRSMKSRNPKRCSSLEIDFAIADLVRFIRNAAPENFLFQLLQ